MFIIVNVFQQLFKFYPSLIHNRNNSTCIKNNRKFIVGGNLKMNGNKTDILKILKTLEAGPLNSNTEVIIAAPAVYLDFLKCNAPRTIQLAAQNCYKEEKGAFTGEISPLMLKDIKVPWVILGHSERRSIFKENDELIAAKVELARKHGLQVIACIGETLDEREAGQTIQIVTKQILALERELNGNWKDLVLAYEPVWAIGTGKNASPEEAQEVHQSIRCFLNGILCPKVAETVRIQYGGSVTAKNCRKLAAQPDIDGFLVGGASLKPEFIEIINAKS